MRVGSLFAGIGGFDLAARWMGWETAWFSEIDPYAIRVFTKNFPGVPNLGDITTITNPPPVDMLVGGFPCQDISSAKQNGNEGLDGKRSGLWVDYCRLIGEVRPRWIVAENSPLLRRRGARRVLSDLNTLGYAAEWHLVPAVNAGAPHERDRFWLVAYPKGVGLEGGRYPGAVCDPASRQWAGQPPRSRGGGNGVWPPAPGVRGVDDGIPHRVDRIRCLGNAIVPAVALKFCKSIADYEARHTAGLSSF